MTRVGVIGVGSMGSQHARVYNSFQDAELVGVADANKTAASETAKKYNTDAFDKKELLERVEALSIVVPTQYHYEITREAIEANVDVLVEKPFVANPDNGKELIKLAEQEGTLIQVGHIERFNPAVMVLEDVLADKNVLAYEARRLGPAPNRGIRDSVVMDLMIHDIDIIRWLADDTPDVIQATGLTERTGQKGAHATTTFMFDSEKMATITASHITQKKVRELRISTEECYVMVDYLDGQIEIHRESVPELVSGEEEVRYRHESVVERPVVDNTEPLKNELSSFLSAVEGDHELFVDAKQGLDAVKLGRTVEQEAFSSTK